MTFTNSRICSIGYGLIVCELCTSSKCYCFYILSKYVYSVWKNTRQNVTFIMMTLSVDRQYILHFCHLLTKKKNETYDYIAGGDFIEGGP